MANNTIYVVRVKSPDRVNPIDVTIIHTLPYLYPEDALRTACRNVWKRTARRSDNGMRKYGMQRTTGTTGKSGHFTPGTLGSNDDWSSCGEPLHATILSVTVNGAGVNA